MIAHNVYFALNDASDAARQRLVTACYKYLTNHPGVVYFAAGTLAQGLDRPVNVQDFDVSLHVFFDTRANHDLYQDAPRHHEFIAEQKPNWGKVRVFDSEIATAV